ncbi:TetR/AcrR family transcriptional regulator [Streptacidiphilus sp. ASG 303]|uniref:TetR family transcriptional regulator n=1 Tax=Streptacidiphilus sp. ASG 303 TaxID=2896847 RepID=UPI001E37DD5D|nr:TetR family transcriptional regulator [Streptacidiphilus sp. ASG 303]MCD0480927.1 TetR/AcrR family transcriptional regulator [Streptacidiphilus sp. ASG 303]
MAGDGTAAPAGAAGGPGQRRKELLDAADRVIRRDGPRASMNAIAAEAGISKPILYRHFTDRQGLFAALAERHTAGLLSAMRSALALPLERRDLVEAVLDTYLAAIEARPQVYRFLTHPEAADGLGPGRPLAPALQKIADEIAASVRRHVDLGAQADLLSETWGRGITGMVLAAGDWWLAERPCPREEMVRALADLLWGRLAAAGQRPVAATGAAPREREPEE